MHQPTYLNGEVILKSACPFCIVLYPSFSLGWLTYARMAQPASPSELSVEMAPKKAGAAPVPGQRSVADLWPKAKAGSKKEARGGKGGAEESDGGDDAVKKLLAHDRGIRQLASATQLAFRAPSKSSVAEKLLEVNAAHNAAKPEKGGPHPMGPPRWSNLLQTLECWPEVLDSETPAEERDAYMQGHTAIKDQNAGIEELHRIESLVSYYEVRKMAKGDDVLLKINARFHKRLPYCKPWTLGEVDCAGELAVDALPRILLAFDMAGWSMSGPAPPGPLFRKLQGGSGSRG